MIVTSAFERVYKICNFVPNNSLGADLNQVTVQNNLKLNFILEGLYYKVQKQSKI